MADETARTIVEQRIDSELQFATLLLEDLPNVARDWDHMEEGERISWSLDWDQQMGYLGLLDRAYVDGSMTIKQQTRYQALLARLRQAWPTIELLNLQRPSMLERTDGNRPAKSG